VSGFPTIFKWEVFELLVEDLDITIEWLAIFVKVDENKPAPKSYLRLRKTKLLGDNIRKIPTIGNVN